ncbi:hypothetical protein [Aliamphritea spongicola]|uniref:hypothetical protein n=1 Tax=Aliamphritea spongicola TaxID=707589 RepID=UPI00196B6CD5|nr:hypothetical protein [Aliamphritea spongicola]MBN3563744.1 hypothetical protein [Aliamphritea spongicola]
MTGLFIARNIRKIAGRLKIGGDAVAVNILQAAKVLVNFELYQLQGGRSEAGGKIGFGSERLFRISRFGFIALGFFFSWFFVILSVTGATATHNVPLFC